MISKCDIPAVKRFPQKEARIKELLADNTEFASICRDYSDVIAEIGEHEIAFGKSAKDLTDLIQLRLELEREIRNYIQPPPQRKRN